MQGQESDTRQYLDAKTANFSQHDFNDYTLMQYEKSNSLALGYYRMTRNAKKLMTAALVITWNINRVTPFTEREYADGTWVCAPIMHVAKLMGIDATKKNNKYMYQIIKNSIDDAVNARCRIVDDETSYAEGFAIIDRIIYNPESDGNVYFHINGGTCKHIINKSGNFTVYSLILNNYMDSQGTSAAADLYEILKTEYFKAEKNDTGKWEYYVDYLDLRMKLNLVNTNDPRIVDMLTSGRFSGYEKNRKIALERQEYVKHLDEGIENILDGRRLKVSQYNSYKDFRTRILEPAQKTFRSCYINYGTLLPFMFEYRPLKYGTSVIGIYFTIYTIEAYRKKEMEVGVQLSLFDNSDDTDAGKKAVSPPIYTDAGTPQKPSDMHMRMLAYHDSGIKKKSPGESYKKNTTRSEGLERKEPILNTINFINNLFADKGIEADFDTILGLAQIATSDTVKEKMDLMEQSKSPIESPVAWLTAAIKKDYKPSPRYRTQKAPKKKTQFSQNSYNFEDLENKLLANSQQDPD